MEATKAFRKAVLACAGFGVALSAGSIAYSGSALAAWEPKKPVEFVVMAGKGGGADKLARLIQSIIAKHKLASKPFTPINKPGGSGAEALVYANTAKDPNHTIMVTLNSFYTTPMRQPAINVDITKFAPIARMAEDTFLLWVNKDSGITDVGSFVAAAKKAGDKWIMAGTGKGQEDQLLTDFLNTAYDLKMKYVPYKGGGRVAKELAGNNANSTVNNPSEQLGFYQAGKTAAIAAFTPARLELFGDAPTFKELGKDFVYFMQRSVVGAPGMSEEAESFYRGVFARVYASDEWQTYMQKKSLYGGFLTGKRLKAYWAREKAIHKAMLTKMGEIK
ncbi:MAG: tripartite tricarboxylate transporter substrate binding protein [Alphaproteobacteria bacterium]|nr:tripartite tricarboxylate transporter substrate binding protein [Alphaproteobacteria bacterium]